MNDINAQIDGFHQKINIDAKRAELVDVDVYIEQYGWCKNTYTEV